MSPRVPLGVKLPVEKSLEREKESCKRGSAIFRRELKTASIFRASSIRATGNTTVLPSNVQRNNVATSAGRIANAGATGTVGAKQGAGERSVRPTRGDAWNVRADVLHGSNFTRSESSVHGGNSKKHDEEGERGPDCLLLLHLQFNAINSSE